MSRLTTVAYYSGIPANNTNIEKPLILDNFCEGVLRCGDLAIKQTSNEIIPCDVALIQGYVHENSKMTPHLQVRRKAIDLQKINNKRSLIVDSNLFLYADPGNSNRYLRYSFDGVFPTTGFYFDKDVNPERWQKIKTRLNLSLKEYRTKGEHILVCLQRNGGWSMQGIDSVDWLKSIITQIKKFTDRPILIRNHPGDKVTRHTLRLNIPNVQISKNESLITDLSTAWATVVYNSSPSVASLIEGIPTFVTDPVPQNSQSFEVANVNLENLENPKLFDRSLWIEKLSMSHWNFDELKYGEAWAFFRNYINY